MASSQAGSTVRCDCGRNVNVPSLSRLRERIGEASYESGCGDTIKRMVLSGELPSGSVCSISGKPNTDVMVLEVFAPRFSITQSSSQGNTLLVLVLGIWSLPLIWAASRREPIAEEEGASIVPMPLRVALDSQWKVRGMSQSRLRRLLRSVPIYAQFLEENPHSQIAFASEQQNSPR